MQHGDASRRPLTVMVVIPSLGQGGAELSTVESVSGLAGHGIIVRIVALKQVEAGVAHLAPPGSVTTLGGRSRVHQVVSLRRAIREEAPDIVHTMVFEADLAGRLAAWRLPVRVLTSVVNTAPEDALARNPALSPRKLRIVRFLDRVTAQRFNSGLHAISETTKASAIKSLKVGEADVVVVPRGRRMERLGQRSPGRTATTRSGLAIPSRAPLIVNVGRHEWQKGQELLVRAMPLILRTHPDAKIVIAGRVGAQTHALRQLIERLGLDAAVQLLGHRDDVADIVAACDVFAFPSRYEGLGGALLEAMALEAPIVAADTPAVAETVGGAGILVPPEDPEALGHGIVALLDDDEERRRLASMGKKRFHSRYEFDVVMEQMADMYRQLAV